MSIQPHQYVHGGSLNPPPITLEHVQRGYPPRHRFSEAGYLRHFLSPYRDSSIILNTGLPSSGVSTK